MTDPNVIVQSIDIYPHVDPNSQGETGAATLPVVRGGQGTFVAEACASGWNFTLDVIGGSIERSSGGTLFVGGRYVARMVARDGKRIVSPTLVCTGDDGVGQIFAGFQAMGRHRPCGRVGARRRG